MKYRKKPVVIDAVQWRGGESVAITIIAWIASEGGKAEYIPQHTYPTRNRELMTAPETMKIETLEGNMIAQVSDWIIMGVNKEFYPCKDDIFKKTYDKVENDGQA